MRIEMKLNACAKDRDKLGPFVFCRVRENTFIANHNPTQQAAKLSLADTVATNACIMP